MISTVFLKTTTEIGTKNSRWHNGFLHEWIHIFMYMHIGKMIQEELMRSGMTVTAFADALACHRQNIYEIFDKADINTELLRSCLNFIEK